jgi:acetyl esterase/lipase
VTTLIFLTLAVLCALSTAFAVFTPRRRLLLGWIGWVFGLVPCEAPFAALVVNGFVLGLFAVLGAFGSLLDIAAIVLIGAAMLGDLVLVHRCRAAGPALDLALRADLGEAFQRSVDAELVPSVQRPISAAREAFAPFMSRRRDVAHIADLSYGDAGIRNQLDLYAPDARPTKCPVLIYVHGGGWSHGKKDQSGLPIVYHFASQGWLCVQPNYRLCPDATFPDPLVDIKRVIAWVHQHAGDHGGDPEQVFIAGGSAGGHLSALAALTMNDPTLQPGFEDADTSVVAAIPLYGDYDWLDIHGERATRGLDRSKYLRDAIVKCSADDDVERWQLGSPLHHVRADAPPFFVVHGARDSLLLVEDARHFVDALRNVSRSPVVYAELPGAQHAFDGFQSVRCGSVINAMEWFTSWVRTTQLHAV